MKASGRLARVVPVLGLSLLLAVPSVAASQSGSSYTLSSLHPVAQQKPNSPPGEPTEPQPSSDCGTSAHPSGNDRCEEPGGLPQGQSPSNPDENTNGPERTSPGGPDKPGYGGGVNENDQDGNNGCGNDQDFEDDNEGLCLGREGAPGQPTSTPTTVVGATSTPTTVVGATSTPTTVVGATSTPTTVVGATATPTAEITSSGPTATPTAEVTTSGATATPTTEVAGVQSPPPDTRQTTLETQSVPGQQAETPPGEQPESVPAPEEGAAVLEVEGVQAPPGQPSVTPPAPPAPRVVTTAPRVDVAGVQSPVVTTAPRVDVAGVQSPVVTTAPRVDVAGVQSPPPASLRPPVTQPAQVAGAPGRPASLPTAGDLSLVPAVLGALGLAGATTGAWLRRRRHRER